MASETSLLKEAKKIFSYDSLTEHMWFWFYKMLFCRGEWERYGRPRKMEKEQFAKEYQKVLSGKSGSLELMRSLGLNKDTYFRYVREYKKQMDCIEISEKGNT